jgi:hypothetical protein
MIVADTASPVMVVRMTFSWKFHGESGGWHPSAGIAAGCDVPNKGDGGN